MVPNEYEHRQSGRAVLAVVVAAAILPLRHFVFAAASREAGALTILTVAVLLALLVTGVLFSSFTVQVLHGHLIWSFGPGFFRHMVPLSRIRDARVCDNSWLHGLGMRKNGGVRVYAVAGGSAVEVELEGGERIRLGTNDPEGLLHALREPPESGMERLR